MAEKEGIYNPFRVASPQITEEVLRLEELHIKRVSEAAHLEEGLLILVSKLIEMTRLLSECMFTGDETQMEQCARLGNEVHQEEKIVTKELLLAGVRRDLLRGVLRFPFRLERIGDMLESILNCCRIKNREGVRFGQEAEKELRELLRTLLEMMTKLRDAFHTPEKELLLGLLTQTQELSGMLEDSRSKHWDRVEVGEFASGASSLYRDMLDSIRWADEYLERMTRSLLEMSHGQPTR